MKFKIEEKVKLKETGEVWEIIADKNTAYSPKVEGDPRLKEEKPNAGQDYLLRIVNSKGRFVPFKSVFEEEIEA